MGTKSDYVAGTITVTQGSVDFTGTGTLWRVMGFQEGDTVLLKGYQMVIDAGNVGSGLETQLIASNTSGKFTEAWPGESGTFPYRMRYQSNDSRLSAKVSDFLLRTASGNITAIGELEGTENTLIRFTGPGTVELVDETEVGIKDPNGSLAEMSGWTYDQITGAATAVSYGPQTLTSPQKTQARANIGAFSSSGGTISGDTTVDGSLIAGVSNVEVIRIGPEAGNNIIIQEDASIRVNNGAPSMTWPISIGGNASNADRVHGNQIRSGSAVVMTNASGDATITYPAFPNGAICVVASHGDLSGINIEAQSTGVPNGVFNVKVTRTTDGSPVAVGNVRINYMVIGS